LKLQKKKDIFRNPPARQFSRTALASAQNRDNNDNIIVNVFER